MKPFIVGLAVAVVVSLSLASTTVSAQDKATTAKGVVSAVVADTLTVKVAGKDMAFTIDAKTEVVARGATTATKAAQKEGKNGPKITDVVKVGDEVDVSYKTAAGKMTASSVRVTKKAVTK
jgi:hypothetical protein